MLRIIAALTLTAMLGVTAVPAVAQNLDEGGLFFDEDGDFALVGESEDLEGFFDSELEELEDLFGAGFFFVGNDEERAEAPYVGGGPAVQEFSIEEAESGDVEPSVNIGNEGDNVNQCATVVQSSNSGNVQNIQGVNQFGVGESDDIEFAGSNITISPEVSGECNQTIRQAASAW